MAQKVYIFNPENDLALAHGGDNYTAPPFAAKLRRDLCLLPIWLAQPHSMVLCDNDEQTDWLKRMAPKFDIQTETIGVMQIADLGPCSIEPWGWSMALRHSLAMKGVSADYLPSRDEVNKMRQLSHRRTSIALHRRLRELLGRDLCPIPVELTSVDDVQQFARGHRGCYVKAPWSSSGRGVWHALDPDGRDFSQWTQGTLRRQASVLCEEGLKSIMDFAVEYRCENGAAHVCGYSIFKSDAHSQYQDGLVESTERLHAHIATMYQGIDVVTRALTSALTELVAPHYNGYLGVDMLLYRNGNSRSMVRINPCVELNLRTTMGTITSVLGDRYVAKGSTGHFKIIALDSPVHLRKDLKMDGNKIVSGTINLTPILNDTRYCAVLTVDAPK